MRSLGAKTIPVDGMVDANDLTGRNGITVGLVFIPHDGQSFPILRWWPTLWDGDRCLPHVATFVSAMRFLDLEIVERAQTRIPRPERRRLQKAGREEPRVSVVKLRRVRHDDGTNDGCSDVGWSHQWVVSGHWHRYHTNDGLQPRWIMPYIKGPEDKPLKPPRAKVFAVVR